MTGALCMVDLAWEEGPGARGRVPGHLGCLLYWEGRGESCGCAALQVFSVLPVIRGFAGGA
jgi:hypothetical protein